MYHIHATKKITRIENRYLGNIRIMKIGQHVKQTNLLRSSLSSLIFEDLPYDFVSLSQSLDLFGSLNHILTREQKLSFINQMHLILDTGSKYYNDVKDDPCFKSAL